ncbi:TonB family protein [Labilibaculum sp. K2S]|uniref:TonB family protein n=1 Tax=Labilibaculum sp. K2S TaxID=3056386 RepID=UPI0025A3D760|nr:TonB family protein [Labilibaculum sp. K2S]MDM8160609.1 TonB family protein [Labilibaculum sp. K2S]
MGVMTDYLLQSSAVLVLFYLIYILILRNERFFAEIRFYLLGSAFLALILPLLKFSYAITVESVFVNDSMGDLFVDSLSGEAIQHAKSIISLESLLLLIYLTVCTVLFVRSVLKVLQIRQLIKAGEYQIVDEQKVILLDQSISAFSFFGYIVMNREEFSDKSLNNIFAHEKVHAQQKHWIDLLFVELLTIVFWFNPFVWLYQVAVKQTHELLADDGVIARGFNIGQYQAILMNQIMGTEVLGLANNFNYSITKKRMIMMSKEKSPQNRRYKLLIVIPVVFAVLLFNLQIVEVQAQEKKVEKVVNIIELTGQLIDEQDTPVKGATILNRSNEVGVTSDRNGKFKLLVAEDATLGVRGEGYARKVLILDELTKYAEKTENGYFVKIKMYSESSAQKDETYYKDEQVFVTADQMPEYPGGSLALQKYIAENVKYPAEALKKGIRGRVFVTFIVSKEGDVVQARVVRGVDASLDAEALRVMNSIPKWTPGYEKGKAVHVSYTVPINFDFKDDEKIDEVSVDGRVNMSQMDGVAPKFPGGLVELQKHIVRNVKYPQEAQEKGRTGKVFVTFVVNKLGAVDSVRVAKSVSPSLDAEAIRVIKTLPNWIPGSNDGKPVNVTYTLPINFDLKDDKGLIAVDEPKIGMEKYKGEDVYVIVEKMPEYPGGSLALQKYIAKSVKYPQDAQQKDISGRVFVTFIVSKEGDVVQARVVRGVDPSLDAEALRVMSSIPKWTPGYQKGEAVNVSYTVPINFGLEDDKKKEVEPNRKTSLDSKIESEKEEFIYNDEPVFVIVEEMPEYPGGALKLKEFLASEVSKLDTKYDIGKRCFITFLVTKEGLVANAHVVRGTGDKDVDLKALEIVNSSLKWKPGKQRGQAVNVSYTVPVNFGA